MKQRAAITLLIFGAIYSLFYLRLATRWWFEDDPSLYAAVAGISNPVSIFTDPSVLRGFTTGQAMVPMQLLSLWVDVKLAGFSPAFAHAHQAASFLLALLLLYFVLLREIANDAVAWVASVAWALLPATAAVGQFVSTRHYLEGLLFSLAALLAIRRWPAAGLAFLALALLSKEVFAVATPFVLAARSPHKRAIATVVLAYAAYRWWTIGPALDYGTQWLTAGEYLKFLAKLPYTAAASYAGYALLAGLLWLCWKVQRDAWLPLLLIVAALAAIAPVSLPLYGTIRDPGTWYRIVFVLHTIAIGFGAYFASRVVPRYAAIAGVIAILLIVPGTEKTRRHWLAMTASAEREGRFYLDNPDKLLLSEQAASWFIPGVHAMYGVPEKHWVHVSELETVARGTRVWRYVGRDFEPFTIQ